MRQIIVPLLALYAILACDAAKLNVDSIYWKERAKILNTEAESWIGGQLRLEEGERLANDVLMTLKLKEFNRAFLNPAEFPPAKSFLTSKQDIESSDVFRIIKKMPKGAVLHSHDTAIVSTDYVYYNITFRDNLYVCDENEKLRVKFFKRPTDDCAWKLLSEVRNDANLAREINQRIQWQMSMVVDDPEKEYPDVNTAWTKFRDIFMFITPMLTYRPVYEDHFYRGLQELYNDNVLYLELRSTLPPLYDLDGTTYGPIDVARIYKQVTERFSRDHPDFFGAKIIYAPFRQASHATLKSYLGVMRELKEKLPNFVAGFDLVGQEDKGNTLISFAKELKDLDSSVNFFFHAGETNWYGSSTDENLIDAVLLNAKRIGHGYALVKHPEVLRIARERKIAIEISPISNQVLGLVRDLRNHPGSYLFATGHPVVISNDDPGLWGSKALSYDFYQAFMAMMSKNSDLRSLKQLAINSLEFSSLKSEEKEKAFQAWHRKWNLFVESLTSSYSAVLI
ncbi:adenosine deaminase 2-like [Prorops nasuta]|uniref:adenosine deaminase 2-like n=1 Tax=Prorops nasuta TaxID=863751 RepID=UPI0034CFA30C